VRVLQIKEATWQIAQWPVEIGQYDIEFVPRWAIKYQAPTDFIAEWTNSGLRGIDELPDHWVMYFDGSYILKGVGNVFVLIPPPLKVITLSMLFSLNYQLPIILQNTRG
jgi:hypothetical protein